MPVLAAVPRWAWVAIGGLFLVLAVLAWGHSRYNAGHRSGVTETDAKWKAASDKLIQQAAASGKKADTAAAARQADFAAKVEDEKERIENATAKGESPLDVLFGAPAR